MKFSYLAPLSATASQISATPVAANDVSRRQTEDFWECSVLEGGPDDQIRRDTIDYFASVYGSDPITLGLGSKNVICNGAIFGLINVMGVDATEGDDDRANVFATDTANGQSCIFVSSAIKLGYVFGNEDNFSQGPNDEVVRC